jgi:hypothetical protein
MLNTRERKRRLHVHWMLSKGKTTFPRTDSTFRYRSTGQHTHTQDKHKEGATQLSLNWETGAWAVCAWQLTEKMTTNENSAQHICMCMLGERFLLNN